MEQRDKKMAEIEDIKSHHIQLVKKSLHDTEGQDCSQVVKIKEEKYSSDEEQNEVHEKILVKNDVLRYKESTCEIHQEVYIKEEELSSIEDSDNDDRSMTEIINLSHKYNNIHFKYMSGSSTEVSCGPTSEVLDPPASVFIKEENKMDGEYLYTDSNENEQIFHNTTTVDEGFGSHFLAGYGEPHNLQSGGDTAHSEETEVQGGQETGSVYGNRRNSSLKNEGNKRFRVRFIDDDKEFTCMQNSIKDKKKLKVGDVRKVKWTDACYYPAVMKNIRHDGKVDVQFCTTGIQFTTSVKNVQDARQLQIGDIRPVKWSDQSYYLAEILNITSINYGVCNTDPTDTHDELQKDIEDDPLKKLFIRLGGGLLKCRKCNYVRRDLKRMKIHVKYCYSTQLFHCQFCSYVTKHRHAIRNHKITQHNFGQPIIQCLYCSYISLNFMDVLGHIQRKHNVKMET